MRYGPTFRSDHVLADGTRVTLRLIQPTDKAEIRRQFARLSPESRYRRFFHAVTELSDEALVYLTEVDSNDHVAVVALVDSLDMKTEEGVGVGRFVRLPEASDVAEAAVTIVDDFQRRGLGRLLLEILAEAAKERGIRTFRGEDLASNAPMRRLLEEAGATAGDEVEGATPFDVPLETASEEPALRKVLRAVAGSMLVWLSHLQPRTRR